MRKFIYNTSTLAIISIIVAIAPSVFIPVIYKDTIFTRLSVLFFVLLFMLSLILYGDGLWGLTHKIRQIILRENDSVVFSVLIPGGSFEQHCGKIICITDPLEVETRHDNTKEELTGHLFCMLDKHKIVRVQENETGAYHTVPIFLIQHILD